MAGAALDENRMKMGVPLAQPHFPQRQLGPELCLRSDSQKTAPRVPSLLQNTDELPVASKREISRLEGYKFIFTQASKKHNFIRWCFIFFSPPAISFKSHLQDSVCLICHSSLLLC